MITHNWYRVIATQQANNYRTSLTGNITYIAMRFLCILLYVGLVAAPIGAVMSKRTIRSTSAAFTSSRIFCHRQNERTLCGSTFLRLSHDTNPIQPQGSEAAGLYKKFADYAWSRLGSSGLFRAADLPVELQFNEAPAKGTTDSVVKITTKAMIPAPNVEDLVRYARVALLETVSTSSDESIQSAGIQVLNFVVIPSNSTSLPVLGIDLVSLPGNKHLLLLDAQPMTHPNPFENHWSSWHATFVEGRSHFPWGGDFPEPVQQYVSKNSLWTRLQEQEDPVTIIQHQVWEAFVAHLDLYLELLQECKSDHDKARGSNHQPSYLDYRRNNDPAKPMLNSLYGGNWTQRVLDEVLFPR